MRCERCTVLSHCGLRDSSDKSRCREHVGQCGDGNETSGHRQHLSQPAGAAAAAVPTPEGAGAGREAGDNAAYLLPLLPVPSHTELPACHEEGGEKGVGGAGSLCILWAVWQQQVRFSLQLLTSMSQCLSLDPLSFSVWRQLYTKHLSQSRWMQRAALQAFAVSGLAAGCALAQCWGAHALLLSANCALLSFCPPACS